MLMVKIDPADKPSLRKNIDLTTAGLSAEEGRVATRIDGQTTVKDLCHLVSLPLPRVLEILDRLTRVRVVVWSDAELDAGPRPETVDVDAPNYGNFIFAPDLMMEDGDLSPEKRKQIIWYHAHLDRWSHYEILQVGRRAEAADVKRAFRERSMRWHPDRWPAKHRGSFQGLLEQIFARVQAANQVLSDPKRREEYDAGHIHMVADDDIAEMLEHHRREERERRREQEAIDRRKKRNPMRGRLLRAKELYSDAQKAHADGEVLKALGFAQMALAYEEREDYRELVDTLRAKAESMKLEPPAAKGRALRKSHPLAGGDRAVRRSGSDRPRLWASPYPARV